MFLGIESTLAKKITSHFFVIFWDIFIKFIFYVISNFFQSCYLISHIQKVSTHCEEQNNHGNWLKNKKVIQSQKMPKKLKIFSLKIHKGAGIFKNP